MEIKQIQIGKIKPSPMNPRKTFNEEDINELANNIESQGLLQPITVRPIEFTDELDEETGAVVSFPTSYELVCGERRFRAVSLLKAKEDEANIEKVKNHRKKLDKWQSIACIVREMNDEEAFDAMITENLQRKDVDPIEEAFAFAQLIKKGDKVEDIALRFGKSNRFVLDRVKLNQLIPELMVKVREGAMAISAAMIIAKLNEEDQQDFNKYYQSYNRIDKSSAESYVNRLFLYIHNSIWVERDQEDYQGSCKTTCAECPFNTANHGCLFYEMHSDSDETKCTNREKFFAKERDFIIDSILQEKDNLVKEGEELEPGKTVVCIHRNPYVTDKEVAQQVAEIEEALKAEGIAMVDREKYFESYSSYNKDDERLQDKLANNKVYRVLEVVMGYGGVAFSEHFYEFKKIDSNTAEDAKDTLEVNNLVAKAHRAKELATEKIVQDCRALLDGIDGTKRKGELSEYEQLAIDMIIVEKLSYTFKNKYKLNTMSAGQLLDYVKNNQADRNIWYREFIRDIVTGGNVNYNKPLQTILFGIANEWRPKEALEISQKHTRKLQTTLDKLGEKLKEYGYDVNGNKIKS